MPSIWPLRLKLSTFSMTRAWRGIPSESSLFLLNPEFLDRFESCRFLSSARIIHVMKRDNYLNYVLTFVGSKYGSNGNYDGNDGFFDVSDWKQSKKEYFILLYRIQCLKTSCLISLTDLADSQLAVHSSAIFTVRSSWYDSHILRFFKSNSLARDLLNFKIVHVIAQKQPPKVVSVNHRIFLSNPD